MLFPLLVSPAHIRSAVAQYEEVIRRLPNERYMPLVEDSFTSQISARLRKTILDCDSWTGNLTFAANITISGTYTRRA